MLNQINAATISQAIKTVNEELALIGDATRIAFFAEQRGEIVGVTTEGVAVPSVTAWTEEGHKDNPFSGFAFPTYADFCLDGEPVTLMVQL